MRANADKDRKNQSRAAASGPSPDTSRRLETTEFVDNRAEAAQLRKMQSIADTRPQEMLPVRLPSVYLIDNGPGVAHLKTVQALAERRPSVLSSTPVRIPAHQPTIAAVSNAVQCVNVDDQTVPGGLKNMDPALRRSAFEAYYSDQGQTQQNRDVLLNIHGHSVLLKNRELADIPNPVVHGANDEKNTLWDELDKICDQARRHKTTVDNIGKDVEGMPRPSDEISSADYHEIGVTLTRAAQLDRDLKKDNLDDRMRNEYQYLATRLVDHSVYAEKIADRKNDWEAAFTTRYNVAKSLGVEAGIEEARGVYVKALLTPAVSLMSARSAFDSALDSERDRVIASANDAGGDVNRKSLSVAGKQKSKAIFEDLLRSGNLTLKANAVYRSEFEKERWDFGAEWLLDTYTDRWQTFTNTWVLHGHMKLSVPKIGQKYEQYNFDAARFTPKIVHVKPLAHREDKSWSETVETPAMSKLDVNGLKDLVKRKSLLFESLDANVLQKDESKFFPTALKAINAGKAYRTQLVDRLNTRIEHFAGNNPKAKAAVTQLDNSTLNLESTSRDALLKANTDFIDKEVGRKNQENKQKWLRTHVKNEISPKIQQEHSAFDSFLDDTSVVKRKRIYYKKQVLDGALADSQETHDNFANFAVELDKLP